MPKSVKPKRKKSSWWKNEFKTGQSSIVADAIFMKSKYEMVSPKKPVHRHRFDLHQRKWVGGFPRPKYQEGYDKYCKCGKMKPS